MPYAMAVSGRIGGRRGLLTTWPITTWPRAALWAAMNGTGSIALADTAGYPYNLYQYDLK
jgi:hypothetical protein